MPEPRRVLLATDDGELGAELSGLLEGLGCQVTLVSEPSCALNNLNNERYDLVVMGASLPNLSWSETVDVIKEMSRSTTVMLITRAADESDLRSALNSGGYAVLDRPISTERLSAIIDLGRPGMMVIVRDEALE